MALGPDSHIASLGTVSGGCKAAGHRLGVVWIEITPYSVGYGEILTIR